jgi:hypothetical protein
MIYDLLLVVLPSIFLVVILVILFKSYLNKQLDFLTVKSSQEITLPLRLQAHERLVLFLERIKPQHLLLRNDYSGSSFMPFQGHLLSEVRSEFNHNLAQQIYISPPNWKAIVASTELLMAEINEIAAQLPPDANAKDLALTILSVDSSPSRRLIDETILQLKTDIQSNF